MTKARAAVYAAVVTVVAILAAFIGVASASAATYPLSGNQWKCDHASPVPYMLHPGNAYVTATAGSVKFTATHSPGGFDGAYDSLGYMDSLNSGWYCNNRKTWQPPRLGRQGNPVVSTSYVTSSNFRGDTGFDIWYEPSPYDNTYAQMTTGVGKSSVEEMIWFQRPDWAAWAHYARWSVRIDGHKWYIVAGHVGHGAGWERVFFVPAGSYNGSYSIGGLRLDPFASALIRHHLLPVNDYLEAVDNGGEVSAGAFSLAGYYLSGMAGT